MLIEKRNGKMASLSKKKYLVSVASLTRASPEREAIATIIAKNAKKMLTKEIRLLNDLDA